MKILITAILVFSFTANAELTKEECTNVDIKKINPKAEKVLGPPRNQSALGWCYAFTAADLMSVEVGEQISSAHVAAIFNHSAQQNFFWRTGFKISSLFAKKNVHDTFEGGLIAKAINETVKRGKVCSEKTMPYDADYPGEFRDFIRMVELLKKNVKKKKMTEAEAKKTLSQIYANLSLPPLSEDALHLLLTQNPNNSLDKYLSLACGNSFVSLPAMKVKGLDKPYPQKENGSVLLDLDKFEADKKVFWKTLNKKLDEGRPVALDYNLKNIIGRKGEHASVIIARRWEHEQCEYKVRNSWGKICYPYGFSFECIEEEGAFWISDYYLFEALVKVNFIGE